MKKTHRELQTSEKSGIRTLLNGPDQKRFIYRLLARHDFQPVWLVADK